MSNITQLTTKSIRQQAEEEVSKENAAKALVLMKRKLQELAGAVAVVKGIEIQIADLERQITDGTL